MWSNNALHQTIAVPVDVVTQRMMVQSQLHGQPAPSAAALTASIYRAHVCLPYSLVVSSTDEFHLGSTRLFPRVPCLDHYLLPEQRDLVACVQWHTEAADEYVRAHGSTRVFIFFNPQRS